MATPFRPLVILRHLATAVFVGAGGFSWYLAAKLQFCSDVDVFMQPVCYLFQGYVCFMIALLASGREITPRWIRQIFFCIAAFCPSLLVSWIVLLLGTEWIRDCYIEGVPRWNMVVNQILSILVSLAAAIWLARRKTRPVPTANAPDPNA